jgi:hypothetical protein
MAIDFRNSVAAVLLGTALGAAAAEPDPGASPDPEVFARIGDTVISAQEFDAAVRDGARRKYYHGKIPDPEMAKFQREVGERIIQRVLLFQEAKRRGIEPDPDWVQPRLDAFESKYSSHRDWAANRERVMASADFQLRVESRIFILENLVRDEAGVPSEDDLHRYYAANPDKFTEPERFRVSTILLKVDPSSPREVWEAALEEAETLVARLRDGADFAELARLHSGDGSARTGGDLGYVHRGMFGDAAQAAIDTAEIGAITDPLRLLEGVAIFRVDERPAARLRGFEEVAERARDLWLRDRREAVWGELLDRLREQTDIYVNQQHYLPLPG